MAEETLAALRSLMASHSPPLDALVVPSQDYHQVRTRTLSGSIFAIPFSVFNILFYFIFIFSYTYLLTDVFSD